MAAINVRKAVVPIAGRGTRFHPVTQVVPKEFLPIVNRPLLQHIVDEVLEAGCDELICVVAPGHELVTSYAAAMQWPLKITLVQQSEPRGLGHAVGCAAAAVGDEPFFVLLPDDIVDATVGVTTQLLKALPREQCGIVATRNIPKDQVSAFGIIAPAERQGRMMRVKALVEKPALDAAPSTLMVLGRYLLPPSIFADLRAIQPGALGEIQLTDALQLLAAREGLYALEYEAHATFDAGKPSGWLAANIHFGKKAGFLS